MEQIILFFLVVQGAAFTFSPRYSRPHSSLAAMSSSDLKNTRPSDSVVNRLAKAAQEANLKRQQTPVEREEEVEDEPLRSIIDLAHVIDEELMHHHKVQPTTSSMQKLLEHNDHAPQTSQRDVAIVFAKPLIDGQLSKEYAARICVLARAMKHDQYRPAWIGFCGPPAPAHHVSASAAGLLFFQYVCASNGISLQGIPLRVMESSHGPQMLEAAVEDFVDSGNLEEWLKDSTLLESKTDEYGLTRQEPRHKIHIHWTLVSSDYHLCNINDIHNRSPRQSIFNSMLSGLESAIRSYRGIAKTTWSFRYATYPYIYSEKPLTAFLGKCFLLTEELRPLWVNLKGVSQQVSSYNLKLSFSYLL